MKDKGFLSYSTGKEFLEQWSTIYYSMIALPILSFGYLYLEIYYRGFQPLLAKEHHLSLHIVAWLLCLLLVGASFIIWGRQKRAFAKAKLFRSVLDDYRKKQIVQHLWLVLACVVAELTLALTGERYFAGVFVLLALILIPINRPTEMKLARDFRLTREQTARLLTEPIAED